MLSTTSFINAAAVGNSDHIYLPTGEHMLVVNSNDWSAGQTTFLQAGDGTKFADVKDDAGNKSSFTEDGTTVVPGGICYRLRTTAFTSAITVTPVQVQRR